MSTKHQQLTSGAQEPRTARVVTADDVRSEIKQIRDEVAALKQDRKNWVKTVGAYLGFLAALVALPKAAKEAFETLHARPETTIQQSRVPLSLSYDPDGRAMHFIFPFFAVNNGPRNDSIQHIKARYSYRLDSGDKSADWNESDFEFRENNLGVQFPFTIPQSSSRSLATTITFASSDSNSLRGEGMRRLEIRFFNQFDTEMTLSFCFDLDKDQIAELLQGEGKRFINPECDGGAVP